jgi:hypothetical protein
VLLLALAIYVIATAGWNQRELHVARDDIPASRAAWSGDVIFRPGLAGWSPFFIPKSYCGR